MENTWDLERRILIMWLEGQIRGQCENVGKRSKR